MKALVPVIAGMSRKLSVTLGLLCLLAVSALATDPDWAATLTGARTDITTMLTTYGPVVVSLMVFVFGFRFIVRWIFRALGGL